MKKSLSIVVTPNHSNYRLIAQRHWGLTDEQMRGMDVHHWVPRSLGGTNDPSNLYVMSRSCHRLLHQKMGRGLGFLDPLSEEQEKLRIERMKKTVSEWSEEKRNEWRRKISQSNLNRPQEEKEALAERKRQTRSQRSLKEKEEAKRRRQKTWSNRTKEQNMVASKKRQKTNSEKSPEEKEESRRKRRQTWANKTEEQREESRRKRQQTWANKKVL